MNNTKHSVRTAILIDGGYYRKRAHSLFGAKVLLLALKG